jgi:hypothetical protein
MNTVSSAPGSVMVRGLFQHNKNVLVDSMSDYYNLHALALLSLLFFDRTSAQVSDFY